MAVLSGFNLSLLNMMSSLLAEQTQSDIFSYYGDIHPRHLSSFRNEVENMNKVASEKNKRLSFILTTGGGVVEAAEKMVEIMRHFYSEVNFYVPDQAMSAGTILCMSGDNIFMDYSSSLGPIDPQVENKDGKLVPALGYLDEVEKLIEKSRNNSLTDAEFAILQNQDIATLQRYQQAKELSESLLTEWLFKYKFKDWSKHSSTGKKVTNQQKRARANEIATKLSNNRHWHSHSRMIGINTIRDELKLRIEDYSVLPYKDTIRQYTEAMAEYVGQYRIWPMMHTCQMPAGQGQPNQPQPATGGNT